MDNMKISCPICETIGEKNTFCETCRWFLTDSLDYYSLAPLSSEAVAEFNNNLKNYKLLWKSFAEKEQQGKTEAVAVKEIEKLQEQIQEMREDFAQRLDLLENKITNSSTNNSKTKAVLEEPQQPKVEMLNKEDESQDLQNNSDVVSTYFFGSNPQDGEAIEWIVLAKENNKMLIISKYALECKPFNIGSRSVKWENCTLRNWLNYNFFNSAFSDYEQDKILTVKVSAEENPVFHTDAGRDTFDKIFLLSIGELEKYCNTDKKKQCGATSYAKSKGAVAYSSNENCWWWLRTPGYNQFHAAYVDIDGDVKIYGYSAYNNCAVRPALWIDLNA